jgi:hypothetical protein
MEGIRSSLDQTLFDGLETSAALDFALQNEPPDGTVHV